MGSTTHYCARRLTTSLWLSLLWLACTLNYARADGAFIQAAEITRDESALYLEADYSINLTPPLEDALHRGLALNFLLEFELIYPRWYTLYLWNKTVVSAQQPYRLVFNVLTRDYHLNAGAFEQSFSTVQEALSQMGRVRGLFLIRREQLDRDKSYEAMVRLRLDTSLLPKPFQINALASSEWNLSSDWYRWTVKP
jgi:hypothetical protein